jgi:hypothetical protein
VEVGAGAGDTGGGEAEVAARWLGKLRGEGGLIAAQKLAVQRRQSELEATARRRAAMGSRRAPMPLATAAWDSRLSPAPQEAAAAAQPTALQQQRQQRRAFSDGVVNDRATTGATIFGAPRRGVPSEPGVSILESVHID